MTPKTAFTAGLAALALMALLPGCGPTTYQFAGTGQSVGVDAKLEVNDIEGGNRELRLELNHLPPPGRLGGGLTVYAMWVIPSGQSPQLAGYVEFDEGSRRGTARATTPARRFQVRVTAERNRTVAAPSEHVVARQAVN